VPPGCYWGYRNKPYIGNPGGVEHSTPAGVVPYLMPGIPRTASGAIHKTLRVLHQDKKVNKKLLMTA